MQILMPALSPTMEEGKLAKWLVKEGDEVHSGDLLAEIETDKATMEFEAVDEGRIGKILVPEGTEGVKVNQPIADIACRKAKRPVQGQPKPNPRPGGEKRQAAAIKRTPADTTIEDNRVRRRKRRRSKSPKAQSESRLVAARRATRARRHRNRRT